MTKTDAAKLRTLRDEYKRLQGLEDGHQARGQRFNGLVAELLSCSGISASSDVRGAGEVDVAFALDGRRVVLEAKWQSKQVQTDAIAKLQKRLRQRLGGTLGILLSMSGFTRAAVADLKDGERADVLLLDQTHWEAMLYGSIPARILLDSAIDHASWKGLVYPSIATIEASLPDDEAQRSIAVDASGQASRATKRSSAAPRQRSRARTSRPRTTPVAARPPAAEILRLEGVGKTYANGFVALQGVDLIVREGDFVFVVGPSGAGKTTLMRILGGEDSASTGRVWVAGTDHAATPRSQLKRLLSAVNQDLALNQRISVSRNVTTRLARRAVHAREKAEEVLWLLGMEGKADTRVSELSRGEKQRVALARALITRPRLLIADDVTDNLDPDMSWGVMQTLLQINFRAGTTIVVATNNAQAVDHIRRRVVQLDQGRIVRDEDEGQYVGAS